MNEKGLGYNASKSVIHAQPINAPTSAGYFDPEEAFGRRASRVVVNNRRALIETARVPRIAIFEPLIIKVMAKLVADSLA